MYNFLNAILGGPIPFHLESVDALEKVRWRNKIRKGISPVRIVFRTRTKKSAFRCNPCTLSWSKKPPAQSLSTRLMQVMAAKAEASDPWYASWGWAMAEMGPQDSEIPTCPSSKSQSSQCSPKGNFPLSDGPWGQPRKTQCHYETQPKKKIEYWYTQTLKNSSYPEWLLQLQALCSLKCYEEDRDQRQDSGGWQKGGVAHSAAPDSDHTQTKWRLHVSRVTCQMAAFTILTFMLSCRQPQQPQLRPHPVHHPLPITPMHTPLF